MAITEDCREEGPSATKIQSPEGMSVSLFVEQLPPFKSSMFPVIMNMTYNEVRCLSHVE